MTALDARALYRSIAEYSPLPMAALAGTSHNVVYVNPVFCDLATQTEEQLTGKAFGLVVLPEEEAECVAHLNRVYETGEAEFHTGRDDPNSRLTYWSYAIWPVRDHGQIVGVMIQVTEATPFQRLATALNEALLVGSVRQHELAEQAEKLNEQLRGANEDLRQFAFAASHDLKEPLRNITMFSQLLIRSCGSPLKGNAQHYGQCITEGVTRMQNLLVDLLSYVQADADDEGLQTVVDLNTVLDLAKQNLQAAMDESSASVTSDHLPSVDGHPAHFLQLFQNLISNAIKYRGVEPPCIRISAEPRGGTWLFTIADNGMGIAEEYHKKVFGLFKRLHGSDIPGSGLGLSICRRVVERYLGSIWVESTEGHGAAFHFTLPQRATAAVTQLARAAT